MVRIGRRENLMNWIREKNFLRLDRRQDGRRQNPVGEVPERRREQSGANDVAFSIDSKGKIVAPDRVATKHLNKK